MLSNANRPCRGTSRQHARIHDRCYFHRRVASSEIEVVGLLSYEMPLAEAARQRHTDYSPSSVTPEHPVTATRSDCHWGYRDDFDRLHPAWVS